MMIISPRVHNPIALPHTETPQKKRLAISAGELLTKNGRKYRTIEVISSTPKKSTFKRKCNTNSLSRLLNDYSKRISQPSPSRSDSRNHSNNKISIDIGSPTDRNSNLVNKRLRASQTQEKSDQNIHQLLKIKSLCYAKDLIGGSILDPSSPKIGGTSLVKKKKQSLIEQLSVEASTFLTKKVQGKNSNRSEHQIYLTQTNANKFSRFSIRNKASREQFRVDLELSMIQDHVLLEAKRSDTQIQEDRRMGRLTHDTVLGEWKSRDSIREDLVIQTDTPRQKMERKREQPLRSSKQSEKRYASKDTKSELTESKRSQKPQNNQQDLLRKSATEAKNQASTDTQSKVPQIFHTPVKSPIPLKKESISKLKQVANIKASPQLIFKNSDTDEESLEQIQIEKHRPILAPTPTTISPVVAILERPRSPSPAPAEKLFSLKKRNEELRQVGEVVGLGLKMLKNVKINWMLPCIPLYQKFYQLRLEIQSSIDNLKLDQDFVQKYSIENERIKQSFGNMLKAAQKKPLTSQQLLTIRKLEILNPVDLGTILKQLDEYVVDVKEFDGKEEETVAVKKHLVLVINSVMVLASLINKKVKHRAVNEASEDIDAEVAQGLKLIRSAI